MKFIETQMQFKYDFQGYLDAYDEIDFYNSITEKDEDIRNIAQKK